MLQMIRKYIPESIKRKYRLLRAKLLTIGLRSDTAPNQPPEEICASADISVIIAIHDSPEVTRRCLESVEKYGANAQIILVDDGSELQQTKCLIRDYQQRNGWKVFRDNQPLGHSRACEAGGRLATRPYLCFLNSDTVVTPWSWQPAREAFESDPKIAVTGPSTSWAATIQSIHRAEYCRNYWTNNQIYAFAKKYTSTVPSKTQIDLPMVAGFALFVRRSIWEKFGGFDLKLPDYGNESELCRRLSQSGFRIVWTQNSYIHHFGQGSYGQIMRRSMIKERRLAARDYIKRLHSDSKQN